MALVSRAERKKRRCVALERLNSGMGVSEVNRTLVRDYGITRRNANLDINWASAQIVKNLEKYERKLINILHSRWAFVNKAGIELY